MEIDAIDSVMFDQEEDYSMVELDKEEESGFGFVISGGSDEQHLPGISDPFVCQVRPFSPAYGKVTVGDRIVEVNGVPMQNMTHHEILDEFYKSGNSLNLLLDTGAEIRIVSEVSRRSMVEPVFSKRPADYVQSLPVATRVPSEDLMLDLTQVETSTKEDVTQGDDRSFLFNGVICVSIAVALGAAAVVVFKVARP